MFFYVISSIHFILWGGEREKSGDADPWQVQNPEEQEGNAVLPGRCVAVARVQLTLLILQTHKPTIWGLVLPPIDW